MAWYLWEGVLVLSVETVGIEAWSVSAERVGMVAWFASAERVGVAASGHALVVASAHTSVRAEAAVWALAWVLAQVLAAASVLPSPAVSLEAGVCLPRSPIWGSVPSGMGSPSGCRGGVSPGCG